MKKIIGCLTAAFVFSQADMRSWSARRALALSMNAFWTSGSMVGAAKIKRVRKSGIGLNKQGISQPHNPISELFGCNQEHSLGAE
jgi:hypothetical protein